MLFINYGQDLFYKGRIILPIVMFLDLDFSVVNCLGPLVYLLFGLKYDSVKWFKTPISQFQRNKQPINFL